MTGPGRASAEEARIREAYRRRGAEAAAAGDRYSWLGRGHLLIMQSAERALLDALRGAGITSLARARILEIGCGTGHWLRAMAEWGATPANLVGVDLLPARLGDAQAACARGVGLAGASGTALPVPDRSFDVVLQSTVFSSILNDRTQQMVADEVRRVLRAGGVMLWYDLAVRNPRNPDVRGVSARRIRHLFPGSRIVLRRVTLAPPIARRVAPRSWALASLLASAPLLCSHLAGTIEPRSA